MVYRPDDVGAMAQNITMNKLDIAQQEQEAGFTVEDSRQYLQDRAEDISTTTDILKGSASQGWNISKAKIIKMKKSNEESNLAYANSMLRSELSILSGVNLEKINEEELEKYKSQYQDSPTVQKWVSIIEERKKSILEYEDKIDTIMGHYHDIEQAQLQMIDNLNGGILKGTMPFIDDVVTGLTDWTNLAKNMTIAAAVTLTSPGLMAGLAAKGVGTVGQIAAKKGIEYSLNALDNWITMEQEHELLNPDAPPLTTREKVWGMTVGTVVDGGFDATGYVVGKGIKKIFKSSPKINKATKAQALPNDNIPLNNTSAKEVAKQVYDVEHGIGSANDDLFRMKVEENPDTVYNHTLDPNNPHEDIFDNMFNDEINIENPNYKIDGVSSRDNPVYYRINPDTKEVEKFNIGKDRILPTESVYTKINMVGDKTNIPMIDTVELEIGTTKYKIDNKIPIDERIVPVLPIEKTKDTTKAKLYNLDDFGNIFIEESNYDVALEALQNTSDNGAYAKVKDGRFVTMMFKDGDNVVSVTEDIDYINRPVKHKGNILTNNYLVRKVKDNLHHRVEVIDKQGNKVNIYGMAKEDYINKIKRLKKVDTLAKVINTVAESMNVNKEQVKDGVVVLKGDAGRTIVDIVDPLISEINHKTHSIITNNMKEFKRLMKDPITGKIFFKDLNELLEKTDRGALAELFVHGKTSRTDIFSKKFEDNDIVIKQLQTWINGLVDDNTFVRAYKTKRNLNIDFSNPEVRERYKYILKEMPDGTLDYNNDAGGFFEGLNKDEIEYRILEMVSNPEKIDLGYEKDIPDRKIFYELFEDFTADKQNAVAINRVFKKNKADTTILKDFGIIKDDSTGDITVSMEDFMTGISKMFEEMLNPNSKYSVDEIKNTLSLFQKSDGLPRKFNADTKEYKNFVLYDFILNNKNNSKMDVKQFHQAIAPMIESLDKYLKNKVDNIIPILEEKNINLKTNKSNTTSINKLVSILDKWKRKFSKENGANDYLSTQQYKDELTQVQKLIQDINIDREYIEHSRKLNDIQEVTYKGDITFDNISDKLSPIIDETNDSVQVDMIIRDNIDEVKGVIGRKRNIEKIVTSDDFKGKVDKIVSDLRQQGVTEEVIKKLYSTDYKVLKSGIKEVEDFLYNHSKKRNTFLDNMEELETLKTPEDIREFIKKTRNRKKIKFMLDTMEELGANKDVVDDIRDFVNYHGKEFDYKLDKENIIKNIDNVINSASSFKEKLDVTNYGEKRNAYRKLYTRYSQIRELVKDNTPESSIRFLKSKDLQSIYDDIIEFGKVVGETSEHIDQYKDIIITLQKALNDIQESRKNSPLKNLHKKFTDGYRAITSSERQKFGRLESVINKERWLEDKAWFIMSNSEYNKNISKKTDIPTPKVMKAKFYDFKDISDVPEGFINKIISKDKIQFITELYNNNKDKFRGVEVFDDDGNLISSTPLTLDQFAVIYSKFLEELSDTTGANKKQSIEALKVFFNNEDDMFSFFTQRQQKYNAGYVKDNRTIVSDYNEGNSQIFAEIDTLGMDRVTFANKFNVNNPDVKKALKKYALQVRNIINEETGEVGLDIKDINTSVVSTIRSVSDYIKRTKNRDTFYDGLKDVVEKSYKNFLYNIVDFLYPILLNGTGLIEQMFNPILALRRTSWIDAKGKMFGYKSSNRLLGNAKMFASGVSKGLVLGGVSAINVFANGGLGIYSALATLDKYIFFTNMMNRIFKKDWDFSVHNTGMELTTKFIASITGADQRVLDALLDMYMVKRTLKGKRDFASPKDLPFKGNKIDYLKTAGAEALEAFKEHAMNMQEVADLTRGLLSSIRARDLMEEFMMKSYEDLPESIKSTIKNFGIDINNYNKFTQTLRNIRLDQNDLSLKGVYLMDLMNQRLDIPAENGGFSTEISHILKTQDVDMLNAIQNINNYFYDNAFILDKKLKYSSKSEGAINKIAFALRHTTIGIGLEDVSNIFHEKDATGLYRSKLERFNRINDISKTKIATNMFINGATTLPFILMSAIILSKSGNIIDDAARKPEKIKEDLAEVITNWEILKSRVIEEDNFAKGIFKGLAYLTYNVGLDSTKDMIPISSLINNGNILSSLNPYVADTYLMIQKVLHEPDNVNVDAVNEVLKGLSYDVRYNRIDHMNEGRVMPILNFIYSTAFVRSYGKIPVNWYRAWTTKNDKTYQSKQRKKFINKHSTREWKKAATYGWSSASNFNIFPEKINIENINTSVNKYINLPDDTLVPLPKWEELNEEGKEAIGEYLFDILNTVQEQSLSAHYSSNVNKLYALNEWGKQNNIINEEEYQNRKKKIYNDMGLDDIVNELPPQYKIAFKIIDKNIGAITDIEKQDLHLKMLQDINNGMSANKLINKYNNNQSDNTEKNNTTKKQNNYKDISELPPQYKLYYRVMKKKGYQISEDYLINLANQDAPIPQIPE